VIIITTIGRSGSSALMKWCQAIGYSTGKMYWHPLYKAGMENPQAVRINGKFRARALKKESLEDGRIYKELGNLRASIVKDPQFLVHTEIIEHWVKVKGKIKVVYLNRDFQEIVDSLKRVPEMNSPVFRNHVDLMKQREDDFLNRCKKLNIPFKVWTYPFKDKHDEIFNFIGKGSKEESYQHWNKLIT